MLYTFSTAFYGIDKFHNHLSLMGSCLDGWDYSFNLMGSRLPDDDPSHGGHSAAPLIHPSSDSKNPIFCFTFITAIKSRF